MLDTLYLHIGTHKTSTSSIQSFLNLNKERLSSKYKFKIFSPHEFKLEFNIDKKAGITSIKRINF